jgi:hypothetical protein
MQLWYEASTNNNQHYYITAQALGFPPFPALLSFFGMPSLSNLFLKRFSQFRTFAAQKEDLQARPAVANKGQRMLSVASGTALA